MVINGNAKLVKDLILSQYKFVLSVMTQGALKNLRSNKICEMKILIINFLFDL